MNAEAPFWHEQPMEARTAYKKTPGKTVGDWQKDYRQPVWCGYPNALQGSMGCWSLVYDLVHSEKDCMTCELRWRYENEEKMPGAPDDLPSVDELRPMEADDEQ